MLCQNCQKRVAKVHFTHVVNGIKTEMYLCEQCASEKGQSGIGQFSVNDFLAGLMGTGFGQPEGYVDLPHEERLVCEKCGMTFEEFQRAGKLGCDNCYRIFAGRLKPLLKRLHGSSQHNGKKPERALKEDRALKEIERLKEQLNKAVEKEEYEKAAEIRDKIKELESRGS